ncbi:hypothetical protein PIB30_038830 [Stylosanthes scabra]|uniref:Uncharacterized protein n=1 Tax=Stylosanthes scabra TaxID=79078 RepID=A0ABU6TG68_9FABA|nr:hypothetical protein [Stylosanthes scabra]
MKCTVKVKEEESRFYLHRRGKPSRRRQSVVSPSVSIQCNWNLDPFRCNRKSKNQVYLEALPNSLSLTLTLSSSTHPNRLHPPFPDLQFITGISSTSTAQKGFLTAFGASPGGHCG